MMENISSELLIGKDKRICQMILKVYEAKSFNIYEYLIDKFIYAEEYDESLIDSKLFNRTITHIFNQLCKVGDYDKVKYMLDNFNDYIKFRTNQCIKNAMFNNHINIVKLLLDSNRLDIIDSKYNKNNILYDLRRINNLEMMKLILNSKQVHIAYDGTKVFTYGMAVNNNILLKLLLDINININIQKIEKWLYHDEYTSVYKIKDNKDILKYMIDKDYKFSDKLKQYIDT